MWNLGRKAIEHTGIALISGLGLGVGMRQGNAPRLGDG